MKTLGKIDEILSHLLLELQASSFISFPINGVNQFCGRESEVDRNKLNILISIFIEVSKKVTLAH